MVLWWLFGTCFVVVSLLSGGVSWLVAGCFMVGWWLVG